MTNKTLLLSLARGLTKPLPPFIRVPLRRLLRGIFLKQRFLYHGYTLTGSVDSDFMMNAAMRCDFELHIQALLKSLAALFEGKVTFVDVGANIGLHSMFMSHYSDKVIAFEPNREAYKPLVKALKSKGKTNIHLQCCGLGEEDAYRAFHVPLRGLSCVGSFSDSFVQAREDRYHYSKNRARQLRIKKGDDALAEESLLYPAKIIKIDVEGFEIEVLKGLQQTIVKTRPCMVVEISTENAIERYQEIERQIPESYLCYLITSRPEEPKTPVLKPITLAQLAERCRGQKTGVWNCLFLPQEYQEYNEALRQSAT